MNRLIVLVGVLATIAELSAARILANDLPARSFPAPNVWAYPDGREVGAGYFTTADQSGGGSSQTFNPRGMPLPMPGRPSYAPTSALGYMPGPPPAYRPGALGSGPAYGPPETQEETPEEPHDLMDAVFGNRCGSTPRWTISAGAIVLDRLGSSKSSLVVQDFLTGDVLLTDGDLGANWARGPKIEAICRLDYRWDLDLVYFGADTPSGERSVSGLGLYVPTLSDRILFQSVTAGYNWRIHNGEAGLRLHISPRLTGLIGFRYLDLQEHAVLNAVSELGTTDSMARLINELYGFQIGAKAELLGQDTALHVHGSIKAGIYGNHVTRLQSQAGMFGNSFVHDSKNQTAFIGEVELMTSLDLTKNISVYAGPEVLWLAGMAVAPDYLGTSAGPLRAEQTILSLGILLGMQATW